MLHVPNISTLFVLFMVYLTALSVALIRNRQLKVLCMMNEVENMTSGRDLI
jgi:hypothetical protein